MALFSSLSERLNHILSKLTKRGKLTELEIRTAMREVRIALLEADVNIRVAKQFIADVSEKAVGQQVLQSLNPAQQVIKIVNDELIALMGSPSNSSRSSGGRRRRKSLKRERRLPQKRRSRRWSMP